MATSDREREAVLKMNDWLRQRHRLADTDLFQKLRRCCICLKNSCDYPSMCREQFETWARYKWNRALEAGVEDARGGARRDRAQLPRWALTSTTHVASCTRALTVSASAYLLAGKIFWASGEQSLGAHQFLRG